METTLAWLLGPTPVEGFFDAWRRRTPLVVRRRQPGFYAPVMSLERMDTLLAETRLDPSQVRVVRAGRERPLEEVAGPGWRPFASAHVRLFEELRDGSTLVLHLVEQRDAALRRLCLSLGAQLSASAQVNLYLTPPHAQGMVAHADTHDVIVAQVEGTKTWSLDGAEIELHPGDLLYLPRGVVHVARTTESLSLHLSIGLHAVTWAGMIRGAVEACLTRDPRFQTPVEPGFAADPAAMARTERLLEGLLVDVRAALGAEELVADATEAVLRTQAPPLAGQLCDLRDAASIRLDTRLRRRPGVPWRTAADTDGCHLRGLGKDVHLPAFLAPDLAFMARVEQFRPADLPGGLDEPGRLFLARRLVTEGFLTHARGDGPLSPLPTQAGQRRLGEDDLRVERLIVDLPAVERNGGVGRAPSAVGGGRGAEERYSGGRR